METGTGLAGTGLAGTGLASAAQTATLQPYQATQKHRSLVSKLCEIMEVIGYVPKNGWNAFHKYAYVREADIIDAVRKELTKRKVFVYPTVLNQFITSNSSGDIINLSVKWTFEDAETGETRDCIIPGAGQDKGDKGVYKAMTGSSKYFLMKTFFIPTGDDPEEEDGKSTSTTQKIAKGVINPLPLLNTAPLQTTKPDFSKPENGDEMPTKQEKTNFIKHLRQYINVILPEKNIDDGAEKLQNYVLGFNGVSDTKALTKNQWIETLSRLDEATTENRLEQLLAG